MELKPPDEAHSEKILRVLVVGPPLCGKTSLLRSYCHMDAVAWRDHIVRTIGCHIDTSVLHFRGKQLDIEWLEVGAMEQHHSARSVYYRDFDGAIIVFDAASERSFAAASEWIVELADVLTDRELRHRASANKRHASGDEERSFGNVRRRTAGWADDAHVANALSSPSGEGPLMSPEAAVVQSSHKQQQQNSAQSAAKVEKSYLELMKSTLANMPILLIANKCDSVPSSALLSGNQAGSKYQVAIHRMTTKCKLDVSVEVPDESVSTLCGRFTCRRARTKKVPMDVGEVRVAHATACDDRIPREEIDEFLADLAAIKAGKSGKHAGASSADDRPGGRRAAAGTMHHRPVRQLHAPGM